MGQQGAIYLWSLQSSGLAMMSMCGTVVPYIWWFLLAATCFTSDAVRDEAEWSRDSEEPLPKLGEDCVGANYPKLQKRCEDVQIPRYANSNYDIEHVTVRP